MTDILMYTSQFCPYCTNAERLLESKGFKISRKIYIDEELEELTKMIEITGKRSVPQIYINDQYIGGFDDLREWDTSGELNKILGI
jgi:glutaredoxin 3